MSVTESADAWIVHCKANIANRLEIELECVIVKEQLHEASVRHFELTKLVHFEFKFKRLLMLIGAISL